VRRVGDTSPTVDPHPVDPTPTPTASRRFAIRLVLIVALALAVRLAYVLWYTRSAPTGFDADAYLRLAFGLSHHGRYELGGVATALFPPGFPAFLAALQVLHLDHFSELVVAMAPFGTITVVLVALLGRRIGGDKVGLIAGAIAAVYPNLFLAEGALMSESLTALLVTLALLLALRAIDRPSLSRFAVLGLPLAYGGLTRTDGTLFAVLLVVTVAWCVTASPRNWRRFAALCSAGLIASVVLVGGWLVRNEVQMHAFVPVAINGWTVVGGANCPTTYSGYRFGSWDFNCLQLQQALRTGRRGEIAVNKYVRDRGVDYLKAHLSRLPAVAAARLGITLGVYDPWHELAVEGNAEGRDVGVSHLGYVMYLVLVPFAIAGFVLLGAGAARRVLIVPFVTVLLSTIVGYGNHRFRMPIEPVIVVLAAIAANSLHRIQRDHSARVGSTTSRPR
jgi:4-amino-4-deoxy-L-arabinose transferase-like glycosyltransferase